MFTHNDSEVNIDHSITYKAVEVASRPTKHKSVKRIYSFSIPCSGNWTFNSKFKPNVFFDISEVWDDKIKAWKCYKNETRPFPFPRSLKAINNRKQSASIIIPCKNEFGNIRKAVDKIPRFTNDIEIIFVEGHSHDGSWDEINKVIKEKSKTTKHLNTYLDPDAFSKLSLQSGFREANRYASGGCEIMKDNMQKPNLFGVFLKKFYEELNRQVNTNRHF